MTSEPHWLSFEQITQLQRDEIERVDGVHGTRDEGLLRSAVDRARNKFAYGEADLATLAAAYGFGIARNHPFRDGNKRAAFLAIVVFLRKNGIPFRPEPMDAVSVILQLADGSLDEDGLTRWIVDSWPPGTSRTLA